ncbi:MAG: hypothetical protein KAJ51_15025 [Thermoplasmata archaeon]|nr:hypothetical protein [Thermoplasmata archaeon]
MGKRAFLSALIIFLILALTVLANNSNALTAKVVVKFDQDRIEYTLGRNDSATFIVSGNITCTVDDLIEGYQYIKVSLIAGDSCGWDAGVSPSVLRFYESGTQGFNASILIPKHADNGTENVLGVSGHWHVEPKGENIPHSTGNVYSDRINITIIRIAPPCITEVYEGDPGGSDPGFHLLGFPYVIITVVLPIICIILVLYYVIKKKSMKNDKLNHN